MAKSDEYVPITGRVKIDSHNNVLQVYVLTSVDTRIGVYYWTRVHIPLDVDTARASTDAIGAAMRCLGEDVRKQCAEVADASGHLLHGDDCRECQEARAIAATIRGLEL